MGHHEANDRVVTEQWWGTAETRSPLLAVIAVSAVRCAFSAEIACELSVSKGAIKALPKNIFEKLDVADRTHAVAAKRGIIEL